MFSLVTCLGLAPFMAPVVDVTASGLIIGAITAFAACVSGTVFGAAIGIVIIIGAKKIIK